LRLLVIGDLNLDVAAPFPETQPRGGESRAAIRVEPGGSGATFARCAARLGAEVGFIGCVGEDSVGEMLVRALTEESIDPYVTWSPRPTGVVMALWKAGERTMICSRGANDDLRADAITEERIRNAGHVHLSGYAFLSPEQRPAARRAIELAGRLGRTVSVDPPPASLIETAGSRRFREDLKAVDCLLPNLEEGRLLTGQSSPDDVVDGLAKRFAAGALTLGAEGAVAWSGAERAHQSCAQRLAVDPTGAGDAFAAAFVVRWLEGAPLDEANRSGVTMAEAHLSARAATRP
jgi:ribokinase